MSANLQLPAIGSNYTIRLEIRKGHATAGIDFAAMGNAPIGEGIGIDVCLHDDFSVSNETLAALLGKVLPLQKSAGQLLPVNEQGFQPVVIRFFVPHHADRGWLLGEIAHVNDNCINK